MTSRSTILALFASVALIAGAVDRFAAPPTGPTLADTGYGAAVTHVGGKAYPREAIDSDGFRVRIPAPPRRIASQYWSVDEYLYSIVPPERVVAVSESGLLPGVSNVLDFTRKFRPVLSADPELVLRQNPDLVVVSSGSGSDFTGLIRTSGIPVYRMFVDFTRLNQVEEYIRLFGYLTGEDDRAETVARRFHGEIERARSLRPPGAAAPRVLGYGAHSHYSYGAKTLFDDVVRAAGGVNVAAQNGMEGYDAISGEQVARWNPQWIVSGADPEQIEATRREILADPGVALTEAGRAGHVLVLPNNVFLPMSPFSAARVTTIAEALWR